MKNTLLTKRPHFPQKCNLLPKMPSFLFYRLEKGKTIYILYTMVLIPAMQFTLYCCRYCHICLQYNIYIYTYNNFILLVQFGWFSKQYKFDIEQMWVQFPAANSAFSEKCFASFHAVQGCFSTKVICQDWTCNYSKDKLTHLNLNLLHASFIFCLQSVAL